MHLKSHTYYTCGKGMKNINIITSLWITLCAVFWFIFHQTDLFAFLTDENNRTFTFQILFVVSAASLLILIFGTFKGKKLKAWTALNGLLLTILTYYNLMAWQFASG
jgi:hypothetical protein